MSDHHPITPNQAWSTWLRADPEWEEAKRRLWAMTRDERLQVLTDIEGGDGDDIEDGDVWVGRDPWGEACDIATKGVAAG